jgi:FkbM family methyltransferase
MYVDTRDVGIAGHLMMGRTWEAEVSDFVRRYVAGTVFLDIGANFGWYSLLAARHGAKRVHAFEANPELCELLLRTISINGLSNAVNLHEGAVTRGNEQGVVRLKVDLFFVGGATISAKQQSGKGQRFAEFDVPVLQIDDLHFDTNERYFLKLDIEGAEEQALWGARKFIESTEDVQLLIEYNGLSQELIDWLVSQGFLFRHVPQNGGVQPLAPEDIRKVQQTDMIYAARVR